MLSGLLDPLTASAPAHVVMSLEHNTRVHPGELRFPNLLLSNSHDGTMISPSHPVTATLATSGMEVLCPRSTGLLCLDRAWVANQDQALAASWPLAPAAVAPLLTTVPGDSWSQPFDQAVVVPKSLAQKEPHQLACALEYPPAADSVQQGVGARIIIWASREAVSDGVLGQAGYANADLVRDMASWTVQRQPPTAIADLTLGQYRVAVGEQGVYILLAILVMIPMALLGGAMLTWWDRR